MTHLLQIRDNAGATLYDLLTTAPFYDLKSRRQIAPQSDGRWIESFTLFAGSDSDPEVIGQNVFDLDVILKSIRDYGNNPAANLPIWLYEESEGEDVARRRAPLFFGTQQPIDMIAGGQLMLTNSYQGLLRLTRGDWESILITEVDFDPSTTLYFDTLPIAKGGSIDGRLAEVKLLSQDTGNQILAVGFRANNFGTANFQPCVNWGAGTSTEGSNLSSVFGTSPTAQAAPTANIIGWDETSILTPSTQKVTLEEVSLSALDSVNEDYVGTYTQFMRFGIYNPTDVHGDVYLKITPFSGYEGEFVRGDPVYLNVKTDGSTVVDSVKGYNVGNVTIPYTPQPGATETLADFTFGCDVEIIGTLFAAVDFTLDSTILIPVNNAILDDTQSADWDTSIDSSILHSPAGTISMVSRAERVSADISLTGNIPSDGGVAVYYSEHFDVSGAAPEREISFNYYKRYNSLSV